MREWVRTSVALWGMAILGALCMMPMQCGMLRLVITLKVVFKYMIYNALFYAVVVPIGVAAARSLEMRLLEPVGLAPLSIGMVMGLLLYKVGLAQQVSPHEVLATWKKVLACFYGGINEELWFRLFGVSVIAWLVHKVSQRFCYAVAIAAMSALRMMLLPLIMLNPTSLDVLRCVCLEGACSVVWGMVYVRSSLSAAMACHFVAVLVRRLLLISSYL
jgi:hypothetical protein